MRNKELHGLLSNLSAVRALVHKDTATLSNQCTLVAGVSSLCVALADSPTVLSLDLSDNRVQARGPAQECTRMSVCRGMWHGFW